MPYNPEVFIEKDTITLSDEAKSLLKQADTVYKQNFDGNIWYGRCIFINWYCSIGTCTFCYRSTNKHQQKHPKEARRSMGSMLVEALFSKVFNWRIEFLTGGYGAMPFEDEVEIMRVVSKVYGQKIWLNLGVLNDHQLEQARPYVEGICASMETLHPKVHKDVCPEKPIAPYDDMFNRLKGFKKSIAIIVGLGDTYEDMKYLFEFIKKHNIERVTIYALKPVKGGAFDKGPTTEQFVQWIARLRIRFPKLEIICGTNLRRTEEIGYCIKAGANAVTKFPATKEFGTQAAHTLKHEIEAQGRTFISNITDASRIDWDEEINQLDIKEEYKEELRDKIKNYIKNLETS